MSYTAEERETIINGNDDEKVWSIYTRQKKVMNLLKRKGYTPTKVELEDGVVLSEEYVIDLSKITFKKAITNISDDERKRRSDNMKKLKNK